MRTQAEAKGPMASEDARRFISIYGVEITVSSLPRHSFMIEMAEESNLQAAYKASHEVSQKMDLADEAALQRWAPFKKVTPRVFK